ncbi:glutathione S-transferase family protein [Rhizosaccharibacter radicis]|uniref:Glutathione S-transferase N-terminal domain-containing protein n=1 Tax=Rhizosaccharibacter radicis TaxID=2782605 RepID=A0ABT1VXP9_9PROT|nr:glutathione S-transferase N-terminal domain-containing protein [Acetobacteraceae bacterium KSS12]
MKLFSSATSPYARKVRACAIALGLDDRIELHQASAFDDPPALLEANPLGKVPTLVTEDGLSLFDSAVICEYLDAISPEIPMIPATGAARWLALRIQAIGDGISDASLMRIQLKRFGALPDDAPLIERQKRATTRMLDQLEAEPPDTHLDIGTIAVACALGFLDLRFASDGWRDGRPMLSAWFERISTEPALERTVPV